MNRRLNLKKNGRYICNHSGIRPIFRISRIKKKIAEQAHFLSVQDLGTQPDLVKAGFPPLNSIFWGYIFGAAENTYF